MFVGVWAGERTTGLLLCGGLMEFPKDAIRAYWYVWMTGLGVVLKWKR